MRRAAQRANEQKAWLNNITSSRVIKSPWLQADQWEEDESTPDYRDMVTLRLRAALARAAAEAEAAEAARLDIAGLWEEPQITPPASDEDSDPDPGSTDSMTTASQGSDVAALSWDEFEDAASESEKVTDVLCALPQTPALTYSGPAINDWVPRRPSSEYTSQLEVTHLPTSTGTDDAYFVTDEVFTKMPQGASALPPEPLPNPASKGVTSTPPGPDKSSGELNIGSVSHRATSGPTPPKLAKTSVLTTPLPRKSRIPVKTPPLTRSSSRLSEKPRRDYNSFNTRGHDQSQ